MEAGCLQVWIYVSEYVQRTSIPALALCRARKTDPCEKGMYTIIRHSTFVLVVNMLSS